MPDALTTLAIVALAVTGISLLLARVIPDEYDGLKPAPIPVRRSADR